MVDLAFFFETFFSFLSRRVTGCLPFSFYLSDSALGGNYGRLAVWTSLGRLAGVDLGPTVLWKPASVASFCCFGGPTTANPAFTAHM
jgi:hypothetical protein